MYTVQSSIISLHTFFFKISHEKKTFVEEYVLVLETYDSYKYRTFKYTFQNAYLDCNLSIWPHSLTLFRQA